MIPQVRAAGAVPAALGTHRGRAIQGRYVWAPPRRSLQIKVQGSLWGRERVIAGHRHEEPGSWAHRAAPASVLPW